MANSPRQGKWIVPAGGTWSPSSVVSVVCQLRDAGRDPASGKPTEGLAAIHVAESHKRGGLWTSILYRSFTSGDAFHDWLESYASIHRRTYIYTHSVMDTLILTGWWDRVERRGGVLVRDGKRADRRLTPAVGESERPAAMESDLTTPAEPAPGVYKIHGFVHGVQIDIVRYSTLERTVQWCRHSQYITAGEDEVAAAIGYRWRHDPTAVAGTSYAHRHPIDKAFMWCQWYRLLADWWLDIEGGPWGPTTASLALNFLRRRLPWRTVLHHHDERAGRLEAAAIHGGRRSLWYLGNIGTEATWARFAAVAPARSDRGSLNATLTHWDVRSMYPYLLSRMPFPICKIDYRRKMSVGHLRAALEHHGVLARVTLRTLSPEYPVRTDRGTIYPIGVFVTTLAGPELLHALAEDAVVEVHAAAVYRMGSPFKSAAAPLLALRHQYRESGEKGWELLAKQIANAMSGKLAPNAHHFEPRPRITPPVQWGCWRSRDLEAGTVKDYRTWCGLTWERISTPDSIRPMGAAYAYLTAYGRVMSRAYRSCLPQKSVVAMDTDGIWTIADAPAEFEFASSNDLGGAGDLQRGPTTPVARFWSPQHYWHGAGWVLSGMSRPSIDPGTATARVESRQTVIHTTREAPRPIVYRTASQVPLFDHVDNEQIDADGWIHPPKMWPEI